MRRNAFGRQIASAEVDLDVPVLGHRAVSGDLHPRAVDRARRAGVEVLASRDGHGVFVREGNVIGTSFHPELTGDDRLHAYFSALEA